MAPLKILICGGGCAGPALAFWLARGGHQITVVERSPLLRVTGSQIDLRAQGIEAVKRMGLLDTIRTKLVDEPGVSLVDQNGRPLATILANKSGRGAQSATSEYEIMRGDLVRILHDATKEDVRYIFNTTVDSFEQDGSSVRVLLSDGQRASFDVLVGADGQGSRIRRGIRPQNAPDPFRRLGIYIAYWFVARTTSDTNMRNSYIAPGSRMIMRRSHNDKESQVLFFLRDDSKDLQRMPLASIETQKQFWSERFRDAGWQAGRFIEGMQTAENFYCQEVVQVDTDAWYKERVVLVADAAHCPSPMTGMGTTSALVGAYVLAGEINQNSDDLARAFANYEKTLRPFVAEAQRINPTLLRMLLPKTQFGVSVIHFLTWLLCLLRIPYLISRFSKADKGGWSLPEYDQKYRCTS